MCTLKHVHWTTHSSRAHSTQDRLKDTERERQQTGERRSKRMNDSRYSHTIYTYKPLSGTTKRERTIYMVDSNGAHKALVFSRVYA